MTPDQFVGYIALSLASFAFLCILIGVIERMDCKRCFDIFFCNKPISTDEDTAIVCCCCPCYIVSQIICITNIKLEIFIW